MPGKVTLQVVEGPMAGKRFEFDEHDAFVLGRTPDCHMSLPDDDLMVSRHHFILEANPPDARIRDLGSLNGTYVNDLKIGAREKGETPEDAAKRQFPEVDLKDGDHIRVGQTLLKVCIDIPMICCQCGTEIGDQANRGQYSWIGGSFICDPCREKALAEGLPPKPEPPRCQQCHKNVSKEIGSGRRGEYVCLSCRTKDPAHLLELLIRKAMEGGAKAAPKIEPTFRR